MNDNEKIYYLGRAAQLVLDCNSKIDNIEQLVLLAEAIRTGGDNMAIMMLAMGDAFREFLDAGPEIE